MTNTDHTDSKSSGWACAFAACTVSCLPFLRNTSSSSQGAPNEERYPISSVVHAGSGVTCHPPRLCACMLPGRGLCSPPTSVIQYMFFLFPTGVAHPTCQRVLRLCLPWSPPYLRTMTRTSMAQRLRCPQTHLRHLGDQPTRGGQRFHDLTGWGQPDRYIIVLVLFPYSFDEAFQHTCANHLFHVCIDDHLLADTSTLLEHSVLIKLSHGLIPFP